MPSKKPTLPKVHFGKANHKEMDWTKHHSDDNADDDELEETPKDVKAMLGFDPKKKTKTKTKTK